jgi:myosin-7
MSSLLDRPRLVTEGARPEDGVPDMTVISDIDEFGINTNLKTRYKHGRIYTYSDTILVAVNPYKLLDIYEMETISKYSGKTMPDLPPHIFAIAESALRYFRNERKNQSCIISGESGAGKTENTKFILQYLCSVTYSESKWAEQQILEANTVLESFGNAKTLRNDNSSRFGKFIQVCFDHRGQICGCIIQDYLLELSRISFQSPGERNYHIFYQLIAGAKNNKDLNDELLLEQPQHYNYLNQSDCYLLDNVDDSQMFDGLCLALQVLHVSPDLMNGIFQVLSAILHIGNLEFEDVDRETCQLTKKDRNLIRKIARLLGIQDDLIIKACTSREIIVRGTVTNIIFKYHEARENRHAMAKALYSRTFTWLVQQINSCNNPGVDSSHFIGVLDIFGFEKFKVNSFEQLCINYTNEKLHKFFNHYVFALEQQQYREEGIKFSHINFTDNTVCLELIESGPKCVLRLLDEECRFPKGTDQSYLNKLQNEVHKHSHFIKGDDKRRWDIEFGIHHYAGPVVYSIRGFIDKNKDVQQEMFFDIMETSLNPFVTELTKYRDMLSTYIEMAKNRTTKSRNLVSGTKTSKGKPTIGDTFRTQLLALVDTLDATTPWYVRCLKPNNDKLSQVYDDELIITQLRYSGMLDIVRIRKEGYPVHVPAKEFLDKYMCLAGKDANLPKDERLAVIHIIRSLKIPETEWQIGKTKVFLRHTVFEPLEERRRVLLTAKMIVIQKVWRGYRIRRRYQKMRNATIIIQKYFRGCRERLLYMRKKRAAIVIQRNIRGMFARELLKELRRKKKEEEERLERLRREKMEKKRKEEEKRRIEMEERAKEEAYRAAQKELMTLSQMANKKAEKTVDSKGKVNLDEMFLFLKDKPRPKGNEEKEFLLKLNDDLEIMFQQSEGVKMPMKPLRAAPEPPVLSFDRRGARAQRKQQREEKVLKRLLGYEDGGASNSEEPFNPSAYPLIKFAETYFNDFPKDTGGFSTFSLRRMPSKIKDPLPKDDMLTFTKNTSLPTSMVHMHLVDNVNLACSIFKDLCKLMKGDIKEEQAVLIIQSCIAYGIDRPELRDEIFCQMIRQVSDNPNDDSTTRGWHFLTLATIAFPPSKNFNKYLQAFFATKSSDPLVGKYAIYCLQTMRIMKPTARKLPPSSIEIEAVKVPTKLICRFYFLDGKAKAMGVDPSATASDVIQDLSNRVELSSTDGWALFEVNPDHESYIKGHTYIADIVSQWERDKRSSMHMTQYTTISKKPSYTAALGGGDSRFVFRKRIFHRPKDIPDDPVEYHLMYAQAVHSVVKLDEFPLNEEVGLQLAGLHAQVLWGDYNDRMMNRYDELEQYIHPRILSLNKTRTREDWKKSIAKSHELFGTGKTALQAKVWYLTAVKHYPLYGYTQFPVVYKGFWSHPNNINLAVGNEGVQFVNQKTKHTLAVYNYSKLETVAVDILEDAITLNMKVTDAKDQKSFNFETQPGLKEEIANLIISYSPHHQNWQTVGETKTTTVKVSEEERTRLWNEIYECRKSLVEQGILRKPIDQSSGFLTTTLRRYVNRQRLEQLAHPGTLEEFDKVFRSYITRHHMHDAAYSYIRDHTGLTQRTLYVNH